MTEDEWSDLTKRLFSHVLLGARQLPDELPDFLAFKRGFNARVSDTVHIEQVRCYVSGMSLFFRRSHVLL